MFRTSRVGRFINQNLFNVITIAIVITFVIIIVQIMNNIEKNKVTNNKVQNTNTIVVEPIYNPQDTAISGDTVDNTNSEMNNEIIDNAVVVDEETVDNKKENKELDNTEGKKEEPSQSVAEEIKTGNTVPKENKDGITVLKFKNTNSHEAISALNGKKVSITGYLSTLSPLNGKFAYLMNMPYQNCPYCVPGTSAITNTLTIVSKDNEKIAP